MPVRVPYKLCVFCHSRYYLLDLSSLDFCSHCLSDLITQFEIHEDEYEDDDPLLHEPYDYGEDDPSNYVMPKEVSDHLGLGPDDHAWIV